LRGDVLELGGISHCPRLDGPLYTPRQAGVNPHSLTLRSLDEAAGERCGA